MAFLQGKHGEISMRQFQIGRPEKGDVRFTGGVQPQTRFGRSDIASGRRTNHFRRAGRWLNGWWDRRAGSSQLALGVSAATIPFAAAERVLFQWSPGDSRWVGMMMVGVLYLMIGLADRSRAERPTEHVDACRPSRLRSHTLPRVYRSGPHEPKGAAIRGKRRRAIEAAIARVPCGSC